MSSRRRIARAYLYVVDYAGNVRSRDTYVALSTTNISDKVLKSEAV